MPQKREECAWIPAGERDEAISGRVGSSSLQVGSCLTPATNLPKAAPLDSRRAFGAALLTLSKRRKDHEKKKRTRHKIPAQTHGASYGDGRRKIAGSGGTMPDSPFPNTCGGCFSAADPSSPERTSRPRGVRRLGGLLKHHFEVVKRTGSANTLAELDAALRAIRRAIEALSEKR